MYKSVLCSLAVKGDLPFGNNPKDLDQSYEMDLAILDCFGSRSVGLFWKEGMDLDLLGYFGREKPLFYN